MTSLVQRPRGWRREKSRARWKKILNRTFIKNALLAALAVTILGSIVVLASFAYVSRDLPDPNSLRDREVSQTTKIYDRTGEHLLYEIHGEKDRTLVKLQQGFCSADDPKLEKDPNGIPLFAVQATIAAEDHSFCSHGGFSITGLARAVLFAGSRGGGSTLTQQLVKNAILTGERTLTRKIKELILSIEIEQRYSKDEILQIYFNEIGYGSSYYGIQSAAENYFGKQVKDLTLAEAATLAALPQRPTTLANNPDLLKERRDWILGQMADAGFISTDERDAAMATDTPITVKTLTDITAPHFVVYVKQLLEDKYGQRDVEEGGLKVITTLDYDKQLMAEQAVADGVDNNKDRYGLTTAGLVALDPKNAQVLAMVGSRDFFDDSIDGQVNVTIQPLQPGSSFKPIVYSLGFAKGYTPNTILWDVKTNFPLPGQPDYSPNDYDLKERGPVTVRYALQNSLNIPAVKMLYLVGVDNAIDYAQSLGYTTFEDRSNFGLAIVLGGAEVKLLEHANAYATFADDGVYHDTVAILKVEDANGNTLEEWKENEGRQAVNQNVARMITNVLADNNARADVFGVSSNLQLGGRPVAAKTGTTNDYKDAWLLGYTPSLVAGVWAGNADHHAMTKGGGANAAGPIWNAFMKSALDGTPVESFTPPAIPVTGKPVLDGQMAGTTVTIDKASGKLATEYTPPAYRETKTFAEYHTILQYVDKNDPLGPPPADPTSDPYYQPWEAGILDWITRKEAETGIVLESGAAPTESDDVHVPGNFPTVTIETPSQDQSFDDRNLTVAVNASAPRGVRRVEFYLDGFYLGSDSFAPYELTTVIPNTIGRGYHTVKVTAYDDVDNTGSASVGIKLNTDGTATGMEILNPKNGETIERIQSNYTVVVSIDRPTDYSSVSVYAEPLGGGGSTLVGSIASPTSPFLTMDWTLPTDGDWVLTAHADGMSGALDTAGIIVHVTSPATAAAPADETAATTDTTTDETAPPPVVTTVPDLNPFVTH